MEGQTFILTEPPPSTNNLFATTKQRKRVKTSKYSAWRTAAQWQVKAQFPRMIEGDVVLDIEVRRPTATSDISNRIKAIEDALTGLVYADDRQVIEVRARWAPIAGCKIHVRPA